MPSPCPISSMNLTARIISSLVLAGGALFITWLGGVAFMIMWGLIALGVFWEWSHLVSGGGLLLQAMGLFYALGMIFAPLVLRADPTLGLQAVVWLFAVVWVTDIMAFFSGRFIGGPKLCPSVSPNKTWAGFIGGTLCGIIAAVGMAFWIGVPSLWPLAVLGLIAAIATHAGDLFESGLKRRFGVKDSGALIPGHGGLMDRLDGFALAGLLMGLVGVAHGGWAAAGQGLLVW